MHKSGFVNIIGNPNTGKSTLINALLGEKLSIITPKAQTTRHRILGILNGKDYQIIFSDTPGILTPQYKLQEKMVSYISQSLIDGDVFLYVVEVSETPNTNKYITKIRQTQKPFLLLINKIDLSNNNELELKVTAWKEICPEAEIIPISALHKANLNYITERILELLPEAPPYYDKEQLTDKSERFIVSEKIREKIFMYYDKEIPYSTEIVVEEFKVEEKIIRIKAIIFCAKESQKGILIGHKGIALKKIGTQARKEIEVFFNKKIYLSLLVKVDKDWKNNENELKKFGYI